MDLEVAILSAKNGDSAGLVKAMTEGGGNEALLSVPGCRSVRVMARTGRDSRSTITSRMRSAEPLADMSQ